MWERELELACTWARLAGGLAEAVWERRDAWTDALKAKREPLTQADLGCQAVILKGLAEHFPQDRVLAEENDAVLDNPERVGKLLQLVGGTLQREVSEAELRAWLNFRGRGESGRTWCVDPIDGTKGFLSRRHYVLAIGLVIDRRPVAAVVAAPRLGMAAPCRRGSPATADPAKAEERLGVLFSAAEWSGVFQEYLDGSARRRISVSEVARPEAALAVASRAHDSEATETVLQRLGAPPPARYDSQIKYALVARGDADAYIRPMSRGVAQRVWDHAAGTLLVSEAGGRVTDFQGKALHFGEEETLPVAGGILATNGRLHERLLQALRPPS